MHSIVTKLWNAVQHMIDGIIGRLPELVAALIIFLGFYILSGFVSRGIQRAVTERRQNLAGAFWTTLFGCYRRTRAGRRPQYCCPFIPGC